MSSKRDEYLKEFNLKKCSVILPKLTFSKIRIVCTAISSTGEKLFSDLKQTDMNTFSLKIKRKKYDNFNEEDGDSDVLHPRKKSKYSANESNIKPSGEIANRIPIVV